MLYGHLEWVEVWDFYEQHHDKIHRYDHYGSGPSEISDYLEDNETIFFDLRIAIGEGTRELENFSNSLKKTIF